jgi:hypothetical protein
VSPVHPWATEFGGEPRTRISDQWSHPSSRRRRRPGRLTLHTGGRPRSRSAAANHPIAFQAMPIARSVDLPYWRSG